MLFERLGGSEDESDSDDMERDSEECERMRVEMA